MTVAAIASAAASAARQRPARRLDLAYGLAYRFTVKIQGVDVGHWQTCSGLKVDFKPVEIKSGGCYDSVRYLAGEVAYPRIVLRRAIVAAQSRSLQAWLAETAQSWVNGAASAGVPATITLYDSYGDTVMTWTLLNARPCAWSGPDLDANASKVAIESLELVHEGFVVGPAEQSATEASASQSRLSLSSGPVTVEFGYPPTEIQLQRTQDPTTSVDTTALNVDNQAVESAGQQVALTRTKRNVTSYLLNNLVVEGDDTRAIVAQLTAWATRTQTKKAGIATQTPVMPDLTFTWGEGFSGVPVRLMRLTVSYTRFSPTGRPIRAKVNLRLDERVLPSAAPPTAVRMAPAHANSPGAPVSLPPSPAGRPGSPPSLPPAGHGGSPAAAPPARPGARNPTSGGPAGRASHVLGAAETLHAVARRMYGSAQRWRDIAAANGIDDPFRVRPGTTLYLPSQAEVEAPDAIDVPRRAS
jgi:phage tail-like protein